MHGDRGKQTICCLIWRTCDSVYVALHPFKCWTRKCVGRSLFHSHSTIQFKRDSLVHGLTHSTCSKLRNTCKQVLQASHPFSTTDYITPSDDYFSLHLHYFSSGKVEKAEMKACIKTGIHVTHFYFFMSSFHCICSMRIMHEKIPLGSILFEGPINNVLSENRKMQCKRLASEGCYEVLMSKPSLVNGGTEMMRNNFEFVAEGVSVEKVDAFTGFFHRRTCSCPYFLSI